MQNPNAPCCLTIAEMSYSCAGLELGVANLTAALSAVNASALVPYTIAYFGSCPRKPQCPL